MSIERLLFDAPVQLISIPAQVQPLSEVLEAITSLPDGETGPDSPFIEVKVLLSEPEPSLRFRIEEALKDKAVRLTRISSVTPSSGIKNTPVSYEELQSINPMVMAVDVFRKKFGGEDMPPHMKTLLQSVIQEIES